MSWKGDEGHIPGLECTYSLDPSLLYERLTQTCSNCEMSSRFSFSTRRASSDMMATCLETLRECDRKVGKLWFCVGLGCRTGDKTNIQSRLHETHRSRNFCMSSMDWMFSLSLACRW